MKLEEVGDDSKEFGKGGLCDRVGRTDVGRWWGEGRKGKKKRFIEERV